MTNITRREKFNLAELQSAAELILQEAKRLGADQAEASIVANHGFMVSGRNADVETIEYNHDKSIEIGVYFDKRSGSASLTDLSKEAIVSAVQAACHIAKFTSQDVDAGLPEETELAFNYPQLELSRAWPISVEQAIQLACECEQEALSVDKRIIMAEEIRVATGEAFSLYANSLGFMGHFPSSHHELSCVLVGKEKEQMQRDYAYTVAVDPKQLRNVRDVAQEAAARTLQRLGARPLRTTKAPVIFIAEEARGLIGSFAAAIKGSNLYRKASFLLDHLDKQIFPKFINIYEQPHLPLAAGSSPFDDDGVLTRPNQFIQQGYLKSYALSVYSARKLKSKTTGNAGGMHNLTVSPGKSDLQALIKEMGRGLLITEMMGHGTNLLTGDYSRGAAGLWVENGEIQYPVQEITVAGHLQDIFKNIVAVGNDVDVRGNVRTGSILIEEMMIAGN